jgi:septal ring factor EnvC (AmiA/AmiB activator)
MHRSPTYFRLNKHSLWIFIALLFFAFMAPEQPKDKKKLEQSKKKLENQIGYTRKLLKETSSKKKASLNELSLIKRQISNRKELILVYNREIQQANVEINQHNQDIEDLETQLAQLKLDYGSLIYQSYKARNHTDQWMYIFSSEDFYQAFSRIRYLNAISDSRKAAVKRILNNEESIRQEIALLEKLKEERYALMTSKEQEAQKLNQNKNQQQVVVQRIANKEKDLKRQLAQQRKEWKKLNDEIKRIIAEEMKKQGSSDKPGRIPLTPAEKELAANFAGNKGKLPWPSERGQITGKFGSHPHPYLRVTVDNKGVDIRTEKGSTARAVFDGKVKTIIQLGKFKAILVQHGSYFTVYSNLSEVYVSPNEMIKTKQALGLVGTSSETGETVLHFELWSTKTNTPQNPQYWLLRK